jgi:inner membrane transporter RhtA
MTELVRPSHARLADRLPPHALFMVSALFHYLGPSFAILLFSQVGVLGVAWLRIASAAAVFALWRRPWLILIDGDLRGRTLIIGVTLALIRPTHFGVDGGNEQQALILGVGARR